MVGVSPVNRNQRKILACFKKAKQKPLNSENWEKVRALEFELWDMRQVMYYKLFNNYKTTLWFKGIQGSTQEKFFQIDKKIKKIFPKEQAMLKMKKQLFDQATKFECEK
jgi:hypothetical protein